MMTDWWGAFGPSVIRVVNILLDVLFYAFFVGILIYLFS